MKPELLASIKDFMALSGVSERRAKRRMAGLKENHKHVDLWQYCAWYRQNYRTALEYVLTKRYDPTHVTKLCARIFNELCIGVAINHRIAKIDDNSVDFNFKDYRRGGKQQSLKLSHEEFIRWLCHAHPATRLRAHTPLRHPGQH